MLLLKKREKGWKKAEFRSARRCLTATEICSEKGITGAFRKMTLRFTAKPTHFARRADKKAIETRLWLPRSRRAGIVRGWCGNSKSARLSSANRRLFRAESGGFVKTALMS